MDLGIRNLLPRFFPDELLQTGYSLEKYGCAEVAWWYEDALQVTHLFAEHNYAILGGDVWTKARGQFVSIGDNWYLNQDELEWERYVLESKMKTLSYIENYHQRNGPEYYYVLVAGGENWKQEIHLR